MTRGKDTMLFFPLITFPSRELTLLAPVLLAKSRPCGDDDHNEIYSCVDVFS